MLKPTDPTGLRPLTPVNSPASAKTVGDAREESVTRLNQIALGKEYSATVQARLHDGQFLVRIANAAARMPLPAGTQPGDRLNLTLISHQPRPTFLLTSGNGTGSAPTSVSDTGRLIDQMRQLAQRQGLPNRVLGGPPLLQAASAAGPAMAQQLAKALQNMLDGSGLFYESHVGEWAGNQRSLERLMREPQAALQRHGGDAAIQKLNAEPGAAGKTIAASVLSDDLAADAQQADTVLRLGGPDNPQAARLVSLQLELLEHRRTAWEGELWPGQKLLWEISDETPEQAQGEERADAAVWQSKIRIELPHLGAVSAQLQLQGDHVRVQLLAASADTAGLLQDKSKNLMEALEAAGSDLDQFTVKQDERA